MTKYPLAISLFSILSFSCDQGEAPSRQLAEKPESSEDEFANPGSATRPISPTPVPSATPIPNKVVSQGIDLFVLAGQSNARGHQGDAAGFKAEPIDEKILFRGNFAPISGGAANSAWVKLQPQVGTFAKGHFGPEVALARKLADAGLNPAVYKYTASSTSIYEDWRLPGGTGLYSSMVRDLLAAKVLLEKSSGKTVAFRGFIWIQGESDAQTAATAKLYHDSLLKIVNDFRTNVAKTPDMPILLGVDEQHPWVVANPAVVDAQKKLAVDLKNVVATSMIGLAKADTTHLTPVGLLAHGQRLFEALLPLLQE